MAYEMVMPYHLHMPSYFLETFTEYPWLRVFFLFVLSPQGYGVNSITLGVNSKAYGDNSKGYGDRIHPYKKT